MAMPAVSRKTIISEELMAQVLQLRLANVPYREIGKRISRSLAQTYRIANAAMQRICKPELVEDARKIELERVDHYAEKVYARWEAAYEAVLKADAEYEEARKAYVANPKKKPKPEPAIAVESRFLTLTEMLLKISSQRCRIAGVLSTPPLVQNINVTTSGGGPQQVIFGRVLHDDRFRSRFLDLVGPLFDGKANARGNGGANGSAVDHGGTPAGDNGCAHPGSDGQDPSAFDRVPAGPREDDAGGEGVPGLDLGELAEEKDPPLEPRG